MNHDERPIRRPRRTRIGLLAVLLIPLLLLLNVPVLAAVVPSALIAAVSFNVLGQDPQPALPRAQLVDPHDRAELHRLTHAQTITATTRRVG